MNTSVAITDKLEGDTDVKTGTAYVLMRKNNKMVAVIEEKQLAGTIDWKSEEILLQCGYRIRCQYKEKQDGTLEVKKAISKITNSHVTRLYEKMDGIVEHVRLFKFVFQNTKTEPHAVTGRCVLSEYVAPIHLTKKGIYLIQKACGASYQLDGQYIILVGWCRAYIESDKGGPFHWELVEVKNSLHYWMKCQRKEGAKTVRVVDNALEFCLNVSFSKPYVVPAGTMFEGKIGPEGKKVTMRCLSSKMIFDDGVHIPLEEMIQTAIPGESTLCWCRPVVKRVEELFSRDWDGGNQGIPATDVPVLEIRELYPTEKNRKLKCMLECVMNVEFGSPLFPRVYLGKEFPSGRHVFCYTSGTIMENGVAVPYRQIEKEVHSGKRQPYIATWCRWIADEETRFKIVAVDDVWEILEIFTTTMELKKKEQIEVGDNVRRSLLRHED